MTSTLFTNLSNNITNLCNFFHVAQNIKDFTALQQRVNITKSLAWGSVGIKSSKYISCCLSKMSQHERKIKPTESLRKRPSRCLHAAGMSEEIWGVCFRKQAAENFLWIYQREQ